MTELGAIAETVRMMFEGASFEELRATPGLAYLVKDTALFVLPSVIGVVAGIATWRETPLAKSLGVPAEASNSWTMRAAQRIKQRA